MNFRTPTAAQIATLKAVLFATCLIPLALYIQRGFDDALGANPIETITRASGEWTLRFLLLTLAVTPLRRFTGLNWLLRIRRMLGLFTFFYACLHATTYFWLDQFFDLHGIAKDIMKRPFITVGFSAFLLLIPLAVTSNNYMIRRMGGRRWQSLHRSVYAIAVLAIVHYWWLVKADILEPAIYAVLLAALLGMRGWWRELERRRQLAAAPLPPPPPGKVIPLVVKAPR